MTIERHFIQLAGRRVHLRKAGSGPVVLMTHQSPRSSAEYEPLMRRWSRCFTCIAPDTPGFGQSDPLAVPEPAIGDYADALVELMAALGLSGIAGYGFHSGSVILVEAARRAPGRFAALALGGYAFWSAEELASFEDGFLPVLEPSAFGEHLSWLWNRVLEQTWFFPWHYARDDKRLPAPHDDPAEVQAIVEDLLAAGDAYRHGYGAVVRAPRDLSDFAASLLPVLLATYEGDPLFEHLERSGALPPAWRVEAVASEAELEAAAEAHLLAHARVAAGEVPGDPGEGFVHVATEGFDGRIHWRGLREAAKVLLHAPGGALDLLELPADHLAIDLPGHGLSDRMGESGNAGLDRWAGAVGAALSALVEGPPPVVVGEGLSALLALAVGTRIGAPSVEGLRAHLPPPEQGEAWRGAALPDLTPGRFGEHLHRAWGTVRAGHMFWPWFAPSAGNAIPLAPGSLEPQRLAREHLALVRARDGAALVEAVLRADRDALLRAAPPVAAWHVEPWAQTRPADHRHPIWRPKESGHD